MFKSFMAEREKPVLRERQLAFRRITVDIDGTVVMLAIPVIEAVNRRFGTDYSLKQLDAYGWLDKKLQADCGLSAEEACRVWFDIESCRAAPPIHSAVRALRALTLRGAELFFVSARPPFNKEVTEEWFKRHLPFLAETSQVMVRENMTSLRGIETKVQKIREIAPDIHVEDSWEVASLLCGIKVVLVKQSWNQEAPQELRKSWFEIYHFLVHGRFPS